MGGWEGYRVATVRRFEAGVQGPRPQVWIELHRLGGRLLRCGSCGTVVETVHDVAQGWVRDLPIFDADTWLFVWRCRVWCAECGGPKLELLDWLAPYARVTRRLVLGRYGETRNADVGRLLLEPPGVRDHQGVRAGATINVNPIAPRNQR